MAILIPVKDRVKHGNSLSVQWLRLGAFTPWAQGLIPGQGTKIPQAPWHGKKKKRKKKSKTKKLLEIKRDHLL